jgi:hypothetical protein
MTQPTTPEGWKMGTMTDTADGNVATGDQRIAFAALVEALHDNSLDAIVEVVGAPAEYNRGKAAMREWFMNRLRYFLATISAPGTPVVPPLSNAEAVVPASPSPPVGGGISAETCKPQSHARQDAGAQAAQREAIEALEPFAAFAAHVEREHPGWDHDQYRTRMCDGLCSQFTFEMSAFRKARAVLALFAYHSLTKVTP